MYEFLLNGCLTVLAVSLMGFFFNGCNYVSNSALVLVSNNYIH